MVSVCTGLLGEVGLVSASVDTRLYTEYQSLFAPFMIVSDCLFTFKYIYPECMKVE